MSLILISELYTLVFLLQSFRVSKRAVEICFNTQEYQRTVQVFIRMFFAKWAKAHRFAP